MRVKKSDANVEAELRFGADYQKAVQALNFFAVHSGGRINKMKAIKLIFFADRYHLRRYGRPIIGDRYVAMPYGPVASTAKDLAESTVFLADCQRQYVEDHLDRTADNYFLMSTAQVDNDVFSDSDLEALQFAWDEFGRFDEFALADITHAYPEWGKHEAALRASSCNPPIMKYEDFFEDPDPNNPGLATLGFRDPFASAEEGLQVALEIARERTALDAIWGR